MTVTVPVAGFPPPTAVTDLDEAVVLTSDPAKGLVFSRFADAGLPAKAWELRYVGKRALVGLLLRRHYESHGHDKSFDWIPPGAVLEERVVYREGPQIQVRTNASIDARLVLERAVAHDT